MRFIDFVVGKSGSMHGVSRSRQNNGFEEVGQCGKVETCKVQTMRGDRHHVLKLFNVGENPEGCGDAKHYASVRLGG